MTRAPADAPLRGTDPLLFLSLFPRAQEELAAGEDVAHCPSCSLVVHVIYNLADFAPGGDGGGAGAAQAVSVA